MKETLIDSLIWPSLKKIHSVLISRCLLTLSRLTERGFIECMCMCGEGGGGIGSYFSELGAVVGQIGGTFYTKIVISQSLF